MAYAVARIIDHLDETEADSGNPDRHPAFTELVVCVSPNNRWLGGADADDPTIQVGDTRNLSIIQNWNVGTSTYFFPIGDGETTDVSDLTVALGCIDDDGSIWTLDGTTPSGKVFELPLGQINTPQYRFTLDPLPDAEAYAFRVATPFSMPDGSTLLVFVETAASGSGLRGKGCHTYNKQTGVYAQVPLGWMVLCAFQDDNGDVWVCGVDDINGGPVTTARFERLTDVTGASPYTATQSFTGLPDLLAYDVAVDNQTKVWGTFVNGCFVGGWMEAQTSGSGLGTAFKVNYLVKLNLSTGTIDTAIPSAPAGYAWGLNKQPIPSESPFICLQLVPDPVAIYVDGDDRKFGFFDTSTLLKTSEYNLDDWNAGDDRKSVTASLWRDAIPQGYLYELEAFFAQSYAIGYFEPDNPDEPIQNVGKVWLYYLEEPADTYGDGLDDDDITIRCWGYSLDGHDMYVLRLGTSESLIYDLTTGMWASWVSPGRDNWRAHVGQNWVGMSTTTMARGFGSDIVCGDDASGTIFVLDPASGRDDRATDSDDYFTRIVTAGMALSGRETLPCGALTLDYAAGNPTQTGASFTLESSDDLGDTWTDHGSVVVTADDFTLPAEWRGLGLARAPGRVFRITDNGASVRLSGADLR